MKMERSHAICLRKLVSGFRYYRNGILLVLTLVIFTNCFFILHNKMTFFRIEGRSHSMKQDTSGTHRRETPISIATAVTESHQTKIQKAVHGKNLVVLYNAVPKTGSRTFEHLVREYASRRTKKHIKPITFPQNLTKDTGQLKGFLTSLDSGSFVRGHFPYTSINRTDVSVVYINSVRDPVERLISNYYFDIYGDGQTDTGHQRHTYLQYHEQTIDECIEKKGNCFNFVYQYYKRQTFYIFCGNQPFCKLYNRETLKKAKQNLDNYLLVYDVKEFDNMIAMIQKMLPDYFYDVVTAQKHIKMGKQYHTSRKIAPQNSTLAFLKEDLQLEYEFYDYVINRFQALKAKLLSD